MNSSVNLSCVMVISPRKLKGAWNSVNQLSSHPTQKKYKIAIVVASKMVLNPRQKR